MPKNKKQELEKRVSQHIKRIYKDNLKDDEIDESVRKTIRTYYLFSIRSPNSHNRRWNPMDRKNCGTNNVR